MPPSPPTKSLLDGASALLSERIIAYEAGTALKTDVARLAVPLLDNPVSEAQIGLYRSESSRRAALADIDYINQFITQGAPVPGFLEAGPRSRLHFNPRSVRAAIVTSGGIAPGLNRVVHSIVQRHMTTYGCDPGEGGGVFGIYDGIAGLVGDTLDMELLDPAVTQTWLDQGGSVLGSRRHFLMSLGDLAQKVAANLRQAGINILYIIGGDGSLRTASKLAEAVPEIAVVGVPKTMDNDIMWVAQSFGFSTAVEKAAEIIRTLHTESQATRRIGIVELFGADSGFVTANAAHACGRVTLVLIPEMFFGFDNPKDIETVLMSCLDHVRQRVAAMHRGSAIIVIAEGVGKLLNQRLVQINGGAASRDRFAYQVQEHLDGSVIDGRGRSIGSFVNRPRHHIRAIAPNAFDQTYCDRLGALAVETGLAGYTRCVVSYWLSEYVLVPMSLIAGQNKRMTTTGMFWKQIVLSTGQPDLKPGDI